MSGRAREIRGTAGSTRRATSQRNLGHEIDGNPTWWVPVLVTFLVLGLLWIVTFYITQGLWPVAAFGYWNLICGFVLLMAGFGMAMRWR